MQSGENLLREGQDHLMHGWSAEEKTADQPCDLRASQRVKPAERMERSGQDFPAPWAFSLRLAEALSSRSVSPASRDAASVRNERVNSST